MLWDAGLPVSGQRPLLPGMSPPWEASFIARSVGTGGVQIFRQHCPSVWTWWPPDGRYSQPEGISRTPCERNDLLLRNSRRITSRLTEWLVLRWHIWLSRWTEVSPSIHRRRPPTDRMRGVVPRMQLGFLAGVAVTSLEATTRTTTPRIQLRRECANADSQRGQGTPS